MQHLVSQQVQAQAPDLPIVRTPYDAPRLAGNLQEFCGLGSVPCQVLSITAAQYLWAQSHLSPTSRIEDNIRLGCQLWKTFPARLLNLDTDIGIR
jgi:hypothetical protein